MSERIPADIRIGGKIKRSLLPHFLKAIERQGVQFDYGEAKVVFSDDPEKWESELQECLLKMGKDTCHLFFADEEASWGLFDTLEDFLVDNKIPFILRSSSCGSYDADITIFLPEVHDEPIVHTTNEDGELLTRTEELVDLRTDIESLFQNIKKGDCLQKLKEGDCPLDLKEKIFNRLNELLKAYDLMKDKSLPNFELVD